jgi:hypothetical protein
MYQAWFTLVRRVPTDTVPYRSAKYLIMCFNLGNSNLNVSVPFIHVPIRQSPSGVSHENNCEVRILQSANHRSAPLSPGLISKTWSGLSIGFSAIAKRTNTEEHIKGFPRIRCTFITTSVVHARYSKGLTVQLLNTIQWSNNVKQCFELKKIRYLTC